MVVETEDTVSVVAVEMIRVDKSVVKEVTVDVWVGAVDTMVVDSRIVVESVSVSFSVLTDVRVDSDTIVSLTVLVLSDIWVSVVGILVTCVIVRVENDESVSESRTVTTEV